MIDRNQKLINSLEERLRTVSPEFLGDYLTTKIKQYICFLSKPDLSDELLCEIRLEAEKLINDTRDFAIVEQEQKQNKKR